MTLNVVNCYMLTFCFGFDYVHIQVTDENKLKDVDNLWKEFETPEGANKM